jgi:hypothetical protein
MDRRYPRCHPVKALIKVSSQFRKEKYPAPRQLAFFHTPECGVSGRAQKKTRSVRALFDAGSCHQPGRQWGRQRGHHPRSRHRGHQGRRLPARSRGVGMTTPRPPQRSVSTASTRTEPDIHGTRRSPGPPNRLNSAGKTAWTLRAPNASLKRPTHIAGRNRSKPGGGVPRRRCGQ